MARYGCGLMIVFGLCLALLPLWLVVILGVVTGLAIPFIVVGLPFWLLWVLFHNQPNRKR